MASGTLTLTQITTTGTIIVEFVGAATFATGILNVENTRTGVVTASAVVNGANTITVDGGTRYAIYVESYDVTPAFLGVSNHLIITTPSMMNGTAWPVIETQWRTDRITEWQSVYSSVASEDRVTLAVNSRGYWYQQKVRCTEQNARLVIHSLKLNMRIKGRGEEARSA